MDEKNNAVKDFLGDIGDTKDVFTEEVAEPKDGVVVEEKDEKPLPFHKDPKVQRYVEKQVEKALKDFKPSTEQTFRKEVEGINLPDSFVQLIGNDTEEKRKVLKDMSEYLSSIPQKAKEQWLEEQKVQAQKLIEEETRAQDELENYFDEIEETYNVDLSSNAASAKQLRAQFIDYVRKIAPKDENGDVAAFPDLLASFEEFQERNKKPSATRAKALADRGMTRSGESVATTPKGKTWKDVDKYISNLTAN